MDDDPVDAEDKQLYILVGVIAVGILLLFVVGIIGWLLIRDPNRPECTTDADCSAYTCNLTTNTCRTSCTRASDCDALHTCARGGVCRPNAETTSRLNPTPRTCGSYAYDLANLRCFTSCRSDDQCLGGFNCLGGRCTRTAISPVPTSVLPEQAVDVFTVNDRGGSGFTLGALLSQYGGVQRDAPRDSDPTNSPGAGNGGTLPGQGSQVPDPNGQVQDGMNPIIDSNGVTVTNPGQLDDILASENPDEPPFDSNVLSGVFCERGDFCHGEFQGIGQTYGVGSSGEPRNYGPIRGINNRLQVSPGLGFSSDGSPGIFISKDSFPRAACRSTPCDDPCDGPCDIPPGTDDFAAFLQ